MNNTVTQIQLVGALQGYLDLKEDVPAPVTYAIGDIRDITKRTGTFSKTLTLPGTKRNNELLNYYFDINIKAGTFDVNKIQQCILLQDNVPITKNSFLQLTGVRKLQRTQNEDDEVEYTVVIKESIGDFFTQINNQNLSDLDFNEFNHTYNLTEVTASWSHTYLDGYKYVLPFGNGNTNYNLQELLPGFYAKTYWDKIHEAAGYRYVWNASNSPKVRFDDLLIPFNGDIPQLLNNVIDANTVIVDADTDTIGTIQRSYSSVAISSGTYAGGFKSPGFFPPVDDNTAIDFISMPKEVTDPSNYWDDSGTWTPPTGWNPNTPNPFPPGFTGYYVSPFNLSNQSTLDLTIDVNLESYVENNSGSLGNFVNLVGLFNVSVVHFEPVLEVWKRTSNGNGFSPKEIIPLVPNWQPTISHNPNVPLAPFPLAAGAQLPLDQFNGTVNYQLSSVNQGDVLAFRIGFRIRGNTYTDRSFDYVLDVLDLKITIQPSSTFLIAGLNLTMNDFIPDKIKQSDFIKSIYEMYNLYVTVNEEDPYELIYQSRDDYYDSGKTIDWTDKLDRSTEQILEFVPELSSKKMMLTYKRDEKDSMGEAYYDNTEEVYGEQEVIFDNQYVKGLETKELIFAPTLNASTYWGANLPTLPPTRHEPRILIDNGLKPTAAPYTIFETPNISQTLNQYPHLSHFDQISNPSFDINFGICQYYAYQLAGVTNNNLYNLFWRRTMSQINSGKLMTAYFSLSPYDINIMNLNDTIRIDNSYWFINKIIDYDARSNTLTKVELLSIEPQARLPYFGRKSKVIDDEYPAPPIDPIKNSGISKELQKAKQAWQKERDLNNVVANTNSPWLSMGNANIMGPEFSGIIIGDRINATDPGLYVNNLLYSQTGPIYTKGIIIDGGSDLYALDRTRTNDIMIIDGTNDAITNGTPMPIDDDLNWGRPIIKGALNGSYYK